MPSYKSRDASSSSESESFSDVIDTRRSNRSLHRSELRQNAKALEIQGNRLLGNGDYTGAIELFRAALKSFGSRAPLWFNITKVYMRLKNWNDAEEAATKTLRYQPDWTEARYFRGLARKELRRYAGAIHDLQAVLDTEPDSFNALEPLEEAKRRCHPHRSRALAAEVWPSVEHEAIDETEPESDSNDSLQLGDGTPCRQYNHKKCAFGARCRHSHAPDEQSWRDKRGKNVCIHLLLGYCRYSSRRCKYSHTKRYLPSSGWWSRVDRVNYVWQKFRAADRVDRSAPKTLVCGILRGPLPTWFWKDDEDEREDDTVVSRRDSASERAEPLPKSLPSSPTSLPAIPFLLVIVLDDSDLFLEVYSHLVSSLESTAPTVIASDVDTALSHIESSDCIGIIVGDTGITRHTNRVLLTKFVNFIKNGGTGLIGGAFSTFAAEQDARELFNDALGLPWKRGSYFRATFSTNLSNEIVQQNPTLLASYSMKALHLTRLKPGEAVYHEPGEDEAPVVSTTVGKGRLSYIGDVNGEVGATKTALALLGLLDRPPSATSKAPTISAEPDLRSFIKPKGSSKPFIMVLSQGWDESFENDCKDIFSRLKEKAEVFHGLSIDRTLDLLPSPGLAGIFVSTPDILEEENSSLIPALRAYVKSGGILVFGCLFSCHVRFDKFSEFIQTLSGFEWRIAAYTSTSMVLNSKHTLSADVDADASPLPKDFQTKTLFVSGIAPDMALYVADKGEQYYKPLPQTTMSPIVYAKCGEGSLGIVGDVNWGEETTQVILAMFGFKGQ